LAANNGSEMRSTIKSALNRWRRDNLSGTLADFTGTFRLWRPDSFRLTRPQTERTTRANCKAGFGYGFQVLIDTRLELSYFAMQSLPV
jgi:hypothetical protein